MPKPRTWHVPHEFVFHFHGGGDFLVGPDIDTAVIDLARGRALGNSDLGYL